MGKEQQTKTAPDNETAEPAVMPAVEDKPTLTPGQQRVNNFVKTAEKFPPKLKDVDVLFEHQRPELEVPKVIKKKGYVYSWPAIDDIERALHQYGGIWVIVTRTNHPHVPESFFGLDGAITYKGQNILCFCREEVIRMRNETTAAEFNRKATQLTNNTTEYASGIYVEETDFSRETGAIQQSMLENDNDVDF